MTGVDNASASYLYDGRGSVVQTYKENSLTQNLRYDPFGEVVSGAKPYDLIFAHNAEEYNPVTSLTYLRARYYAPTTANFITQDTTLGSLADLNSQNRYAFAEADPVNNQDPTGHTIGRSSYERDMENAGGINEIYNFYVGQTLQNSYNRAASAFYGKLNYARGVDYRSLAAINSISQITQASANYYITQGAMLAASAGSSWGCKPGNLTGQAIKSFASNVNATKNSVNSQIAWVKANKQYQYRQYQAYLAYLAWLAEQRRRAMLQAQLRNNLIAALQAQALSGRKSGFIPTLDEVNAYLIANASANVYILFNEDAAFGFGHSSIALKMPNGTMYVYSYGGVIDIPIAPGVVATVDFSGTYTYSDFWYQNGRIPQMKPNGDRWVESYENYINFTVSSDQINSMNNWAQNYNSNPDWYLLLGHNCYDYVVDVLGAGNVSLTYDFWTSPLNTPNSRYGGANGANNANGFHNGSF